VTGGAWGFGETQATAKTFVQSIQIFEQSDTKITLKSEDGALGNSCSQI